jgi:UDP-N-acetylglucosamine 1-carboxyvinyltransferase
MDCLRIEGGVPLHGTVCVGGSKNAALPIMAASILADGPVSLSEVPNLSDVETLARLLVCLGVQARRDRNRTLHLETVDTAPVKAAYQLVRRMRASFCVFGPLLARRRSAVVSLPGGCNLGSRPVDLHLSGLAALGAKIRIERGYVIASARRLRGATIELCGRRGPTVTGTANVMSAATLARGKTVITSAAMEPEIVDLGRFLISMGARIQGLGTSTIEINGVDQLGSTTYQIIPDRIEAGTLLIAAAIAGGTVRVRGIDTEHLTAVLQALIEAGVEMSSSGNEVTACRSGRPRPIQIVARPYPGIPTDLQAQLSAWLAVGAGTSRIRDAVFPHRFLHVDELRRMGARIERRGATAIVRGVRRLSGARVTATDLRASGALVLAALAAKGETVVRCAGYLDRGYEELDHKLSHLGAKITRLSATALAMAPSRA